MIVNVRKADAQFILETNRKEHIEEFALQLKGWQKAMQLHSEEMRKWVESGGENSKRPKEPTKPVEYTHEYDDYLKKLEYHADLTIALEDYEFDRVINNNFGWKQGFMLNSNTYSSMANN